MRVVIVNEDGKRTPRNYSPAVQQRASERVRMKRQRKSHLLWTTLPTI